MFLEGCAAIKQEITAGKARTATIAEAEKNNRPEEEKAVYRAKKYMNVIPRVMSEDFKGRRARYLSVSTSEKTGRKFVCLPAVEATSIDKVEVGYFTMDTKNPFLDGVNSIVMLDEKFKFLETKKGKPFNHQALRNLKKACLADSNKLRIKHTAIEKRKADEARAIKDAPKIAAQIKQELVAITGKKNISSHPSPSNLLEVIALVRAGKIKNGTYIKLTCKGQCRINQYQVSQPTDYGYLLTHKSLGARKWERGQGLPFLFTSKTDIFKGENIEDKVKYIQYTGLGSYMSLAGNKQALRIKEIK